MNEKMQNQENERRTTEKMPMNDRKEEVQEDKVSLVYNQHERRAG
jgi:hypothetical protein